MEKLFPKIATFLMFSGQAEEAMDFYTGLFEDSRIEAIVHNEDGTVMQATFTLKGQTLMCIDSVANHEFTFTPAISLFVTCDSEEEIDRLFGQLSEGGGVLMPLDEYPHSKKFGWLVDRFGVSWQLNY